MEVRNDCRVPHMTCPVTGQAQTDLVRENSETTLSIGWRLLADIGSDPVHWCRLGLDNPPHAVADEFGRLLKAHAGDDNEVIAGVLAAVDASRDELCNVCGRRCDQITGVDGLDVRCRASRCKEGCDSPSLNPGKSCYPGRILACDRQQNSVVARHPRLVGLTSKGRYGVPSQVPIRHP